MQLKAEPVGTPRLAEVAHMLGLENLSPAELAIIEAYVLAKPVSCTEAACALLGIHMVTISCVVDYVPTDTPDNRLRILRRGEQYRTTLDM